MAEELLDGADVLPAFEKMGCKRVAEGMTRNPLVDPCRLRGAGHGPLYDGLVEMVPPFPPLPVTPS